MPATTYCGSPEPTKECETLGFCDYHLGVDEAEWQESSAEELHRRAEATPLDSYVQMEQWRRDDERYIRRQERSARFGIAP